MSTGKSTAARGTAFWLYNRDDRASDAYLFHRDDESRADVRDAISAMWPRFKPYCHAKSFRGNALSDFHAAIWEMYLACVMLNHDLPLAKPPAAGAPDIRLAVTPRTVWVEANAPDRGAGDNRVERKIRPTGDGGKWALYTPDRDGMMLRYTNAVHEKQKKIDRYLEDGTVSGDEPVVVAINGGLLPDASQGDFEIPDIAKCLYGLGEEYISIPMEFLGARRRVHLCTQRKRRNPSPTWAFPFGREWVPQDGQLVAIDHRGSSPRRLGAAA